MRDGLVFSLNRIATALYLVSVAVPVSKDVVYRSAAWGRKRFSRTFVIWTHIPVTSHAVQTAFSSRHALSLLRHHRVAQRLGGSIPWGALPLLMRHAIVI